MFTHSSSSNSSSSEISVGSPSPPLQQDSVMYFQPIKKMKMCKKSSIRTTSLPCTPNSDEKIKGFSIAEILKKSEKPVQCPKPTDSNLTSKIVRPWDHFNETNTLKTVFPNTFLNHESRLSFDYHQQLQIHLRAQAQFLRHLNFDLIASESGSDRSSSTQSDCCSPEISNRFNDLNQIQSQNISSAKCITSNATPLDALFKMTNKSFDESQGENGKCDVMNLIITRFWLLFELNRFSPSSTIQKLFLFECLRFFHRTS